MKRWKTLLYEWLERNRKDIDILTSFLVTIIPIIMLYSESLGITENTLKYHNKNIYSKLGISSRKQLLRFATLKEHQDKYQTPYTQKSL